MKITIRCAGCDSDFTAFPCESYRKYCSLSCCRSRQEVRADLTPSAPLAYLIGVLLGDGHASKNQFILSVTDRPFADSCEKALRAIGLRPTMARVLPTKPRHKVQWRVVACSASFARWLRGLDVPGVRDLFAEADHRKEFLRGFYESEGSAGCHRVGTVSVKVTNTSLGVLKLFQEWASQRGHRFRLKFARVCYPSGKAAYELVIGTRHLAEAFLADIDPVVKKMRPLGPARFKYVTYRGEKVRLVDLAKQSGLKPTTVYMRVFNCGWDVGRALTTPVANRH